jgi:hypothetical protein
LEKSDTAFPTERKEIMETYDIRGLCKGKLCGKKEQRFSEEGEKDSAKIR